MDLGIREKTAFIAGSSRGIGKAIAETFASEGAKVVVTGRNKDSLLETLEELRLKFGADKVLGFSGDLGTVELTRDILAQVVSTFGAIDIIVGNIGSGRGQRGYEITDSEWYRLLQINLMTNIRVVRAVIPHMIKTGGGVITFIASIAGMETLGAPMAYEAAKAALVAANKNLSYDLARFNIRVNCVSPGNILFPGGTWDEKLQIDRQGTLDYIKSNVPLKRFGTPEEIANMVVFLSSPKAAFVTGSCVVVDGGQLKRF